MNPVLVRIFIDVDDVLAETVQTFCSFYNKKKGTTIAGRDFHSYKWWEVLDCSQLEATRLVCEFFHSPSFSTIPPAKSASLAIAELARQHTLFVVTSRPQWLQKQTKKFLDSHFPGMFKDVFFSKGHFDDRQPTKEKIIKQHKGDLAIEDDPWFAECIQGEGIRVILLARPWNTTNGSIVRLASWDAIVDYINQRV
jgi:uncharacterized HAD superfamily protein